MDWKQELFMALQALIAAMLGGLIGRLATTGGRSRSRGQDRWRGCAGFVSDCVIASYVTGGSNAHVIPAVVVTWIGFLGAGTILRSNGKIS